MGNCVFDVEGGKQVVGGVERGFMVVVVGGDNGVGGYNEVVDYFYRV